MHGVVQTTSMLYASSQVNRDLSISLFRSLTLFRSLSLSLVFQLKRLVGDLAVAQVAVVSFYPSVGLAPGCWHSRISWRTHPLMCGHQNVALGLDAGGLRVLTITRSLMSVDSISLN